MRIRRYRSKNTEHYLVVTSWNKEWDGIGGSHYMLIDLKQMRMILNQRVDNYGRTVPPEEHATMMSPFLVQGKKTRWQRI